ncbi:sensor histidine kinase [Plantactinospora soyae]|uniref:histidine kinase n=1 Tax=Plantactinospora soyae TaxID=1544732 RepID=A0A927MFV9_9ACTN|nr:sensor histidine kinase [Plantactinospora soyae]MBE1490390.1 signal transduction histidine kinase [Plantactinospora soyae]
MVFWRWALIGADVPAAAAVVAAVVLMRPVSGGWVWCLAALLGLPLAVRRCWPVPVLGIVLAAAGATLIVGVGTEVMVYAVAFALYPVALSSARAASWGLVGALAAVLGPGLLDALVAGLPVVPARDQVESFTTTPVTVAVYSTAVIAGSWALAWAVRTRRGHTAQLTELHTARAVAEERLRIARDVHDVVGHNLSLIAMKAAVAHHLDTDPQLALRVIEQVSRAALDDVRAVLGGLRDAAGPPDAPDLEQLVEETRAAGIAVTIDREDLSSAPSGLRMSAHRILQEALTNVRRHAGATHCRVTVTVASDTLDLTVLDDGVAPTTAGPAGYGLLGMRERVAMHSGSLSVGPEPGGGFAVRATLPFPT